MNNKLDYKKHEFKVEISETTIKRVDGQKFAGISNGVFKIYITKYNKDILYIGITKTYLSSRLSLGFNATKKTGRNGYHGYKWIKSHQGKHLNLIVFVFPKLRSEDDRELVETIEAELVFRTRVKHGKWPEQQNEIHFYNKGNGVVEFSE